MEGCRGAAVSDGGGATTGGGAFAATGVAAGAPGGGAGACSRAESAGLPRASLGGPGALGSSLAGGGFISVACSAATGPDSPGASFHVSTAPSFSSPDAAAAAADFSQ